MLFNSLEFLVFFIVITLSYFLLPPKLRAPLLLFASCYFYMAFVPVYIFILFFTIVVDYIAGILLENSTKNKKGILLCSLVVNIGFLCIFKYYNFFATNIDRGFTLFHWNVKLPLLAILLPVGLSFHTFQAMSYTIEVYRGHQKAERNFLIYALYVMFYPQLVAGPIERPQNLLHQFHSMPGIRFDRERVKSGLLRMGFGLFKKVVIADRLALFVDGTYESPHLQTGWALVIASFFYSFQIYCDFSGYSDIAIGAAKVMGIDLMENFRSPYLAKSIPEFWRRWHISLSTWFRDYLFIPLGGSRVTTQRLCFNLFVVFLISGFWHGANWTFLIWGFLHAVLMILSMLLGKRSSGGKKEDSTAMKVGKMIGVFLLINFTWIFFRAANIDHAKAILKSMVHFKLSGAPMVFNANELFFSGLLIAFLVAKEYAGKPLVLVSNRRFAFQLVLLVASCYLFGVFNYKKFIYFQF